MYPSNKEVAYVIATGPHQPVAVIAAAEIRSVGKERLTATLTAQKGHSEPESSLPCLVKWDYFVRSEAPFRNCKLRAGAVFVHIFCSYLFAPPERG